MSNQHESRSAPGRTATRLLSLAAAFVLVACGGGGGDSPPSPPPPSSGTPVTGTLRGPIGAQVVLQNHGANNLTSTVTLSAGNTDVYDETPFSFSALLAAGTAYQVSLFSMPANQTCSVYKGATGTTPVAATALRVGCEHTYDRISRSSNNAVLGTYYDSRDPVVGGSNEAIGATTAGYGEGRFVAFVSNSAGMANGSTNARRQVFWRDNLTGETFLVSANAAGEEGNDDSWAPSISADGLVVAFESYASNLVAGDTNGVRDVFVRSAIGTAGVQRVSVGTGGVEANAGSYEASVSGDGRVVAFVSGASNLTAGVSGTSTINVIRRDLTTGTNTLISANASGNGVGGSHPALSEDGNRLAFHSYALTLSGDTNGLWDIFVYDHAAGSTTRVSLTSTGGERNQGTESASRVVAPAISGNGRYVAYATTASNVVPGDTNDMQDVFIVDTQTGAVARSSVSSAGVQGNGSSPVGQGERVGLSYDATWVTFSTASNNLGAGAGATGISNAMLRNNVTGETRAITNSTNGSVGPIALSRQGGYAVFGTSNSLDVRYSGSGLFSHFTGATRSWWWVD